MYQYVIGHDALLRIKPQHLKYLFVIPPYFKLFSYYYYYYYYCLYALRLLCTWTTGCPGRTISSLLVGNLFQ